MIVLAKRRWDPPAMGTPSFTFCSLPSSNGFEQLMVEEDDWRRRRGGPGDDRDVVENVRAALAKADGPSAAAAAMRAYGPEIFGLMAAVCDNLDIARERYSSLVDTLAAKLNAFSWYCPLRMWAYANARNLLLAHAPRPDAPSLRAVVTVDLVGAPYRRPAATGYSATMRASLTLQDRILLILRLDRRFTWREVAIIHLADQPSERDVEREGKRLRVRFCEIAAQFEGRASRSGLVKGRRR